jgi:hypothetical protein
MPGAVLDAWAIMAWLKGQQPAAERVRFLLDAADRGERKTNIVNLGDPASGFFHMPSSLRPLPHIMHDF